MRPLGWTAASVAAATLGVLLGVAAPAPDVAAADGAASARALHERLVTLDSHLDTPAQLMRPGFDITVRHDVDTDYAQVDLPRMIEGGLDGGFWVIYTPQGPLTGEGYAAARNQAMLRAVAVREMVAAHPDQFALATESADAARIAAGGRRIVYMSIENSYPLGEDLSLLETFYELGVRMVGPVHFLNNQFADSATDPDGIRWGGLSPAGEALVAEANRLGMVLDGSHAHDAVVEDLLRLSKTPIVLSHSGASAIYDHPRNLQDDLLVAVAERGGVIQMNAYGSYLEPLPGNPARGAALAKLMEELSPLDRLSAAEYDVFLRRRREIDRAHPPTMSDFEVYMTHFLHVLELVGPEHVGVGADWDGGGGVQGMNDVSAIPRITERLLEEGYRAEDLAKIWSGNLLRVLADAAAHAAGGGTGRRQ